jgi:hypothetical protein
VCADTRNSYSLALLFFLKGELLDNPFLHNDPEDIRLREIIASGFAEKDEDDEKTKTKSN